MWLSEVCALGMLDTLLPQNVLVLNLPQPRAAQQKARAASQALMGRIFLAARLLLGVAAALNSCDVGLTCGEVTESGNEFSLFFNENHRFF